MVHAAAEKTNRLATITGEAPMSIPYPTQSAAPSICTPRSHLGRAKKYDPTKTPVAVQPRHSIQK